MKPASPYQSGHALKIMRGTAFGRLPSFWFRLLIELARTDRGVIDLPWRQRLHCRTSSCGRSFRDVSGKGPQAAALGEATVSTRLTQALSEVAPPSRPPDRRNVPAPFLHALPTIGLLPLATWAACSSRRRSQASVSARVHPSQLFGGALLPEQQPVWKRLRLTCAVEERRCSQRASGGHPSTSSAARAGSSGQTQPDHRALPAAGEAFRRRG
jgi:hypothetical protein